MPARNRQSCRRTLVSNGTGGGNPRYPILSPALPAWQGQTFHHNLPARTARPPAPEYCPASSPHGQTPALPATRRADRTDTPAIVIDKHFQYSLAHGNQAALPPPSPSAIRGIPAHLFASCPRTTLSPSNAPKSGNRRKRTPVRRLSWRNSPPVPPAPAGSISTHRVFRSPLPAS